MKASRVFLSAGEASGDAYAAELATRLAPHVERLEGIGAQRLAAAGATLVADSSKWGAVSILQSLKVVPRVLRGYFRARRALRRGAPGLCIPIDFGFMNIRLAGYAKRVGWKVLYFMPPGSWRRDSQGRDLGPITDAVVTPFPWSVPLLEKNGVNAHWWGHPIRELMAKSNRQLALPHRIAVLPGSRHHEIEQNVPLIARILDAVPSDYDLEFALAPGVNAEAFAATWADHCPDRATTFTTGDAYGVLGRARAAIVCSGTATLEAALSNVPMVVVYKVPRSAGFEAKLVGFKMPNHISLPNILLERDLVPEFAHSSIDPAEVAERFLPLLEDGEARNAQLMGFAEIDRLLGESNALERTTELSLELLRSMA